MDREKVIGHLGILRTWCAVNPKYGMGLDVEDCAKAVGWLDDAIKMMKAAGERETTSSVSGKNAATFPRGEGEGEAQGPSVMTISRVLNLKESTPVWLEDVDKKDIMGALFMRNYTGTKCVDFAIVRDWEFECVVADYMDYGVRWRCWTSRPTYEQREATPWN